MADETRHSRALDAQIITDPDELAHKESFNVIEQFRAVADMVETYLQPDRPFKLRPSHLLHLHRAALDGITAYAGNWRPAGIEIGDSKHKPPAAFEVPERVEELCDYVNEKWTEKSPLHLAAYVMWRLNWIHPFAAGGARSSRAVSMSCSVLLTRCCMLRSMSTMLTLRSKASEASAWCWNSAKSFWRSDGEAANSCSLSVSSMPTRSMFA